MPSYFCTIPKVNRRIGLQTRSEVEMKIFKKLNSLELRAVIWILLGAQIFMFAMMLYNYNSFQVFHETLEPVHTKLATVIADLPLWQVSLLISFWITILLLIATIIVGYFYEARQRSLLKSSLNQAELMALKARIQPHFLFNTLNTIVYLIRENQDRAINTTRRLAELYRFILKASDAETILLCEELDCVRQYLLIEQERFGEKLSFSIDLPEDWEKRKVPSLILQPLIENSVRHGLADSLDHGKIEIGFEKNGKKESLVIKDNGMGMGALKLKSLLRSEGYGLQNVNQRWLLFAGNPLRVESQPGLGTICFLDWA